MGTGDNTVYTFKFYNTGNERNLAGWAKWEFNADVKLLSSITTLASLCRGRQMVRPPCPVWSC